MLGFFMLSNEICPDSSLQNIEKRLATFKLPSTNSSGTFANGPAHTSQAQQQQNPVITTEAVEFIDKYTGTRVFNKTAFDIYFSLLKDGTIKSNTQYSLGELSDIINSKLHGVLPSSSSSSSPASPILPLTTSDFSSRSGIEVTYIVESDLTFDLQTNKVIVCNYRVLAERLKVL
jgi:hypothetical protein